MKLISTFILMALLVQSIAQDCFSEFSYYREIALTATANQQVTHHTP